VDVTPSFASCTESFKKEVCGFEWWVMSLQVLRTPRVPLASGAQPMTERDWWHHASKVPA
jgi:hypothetical protein